ncbi:MAG: hypothetical protein JW699_07000 [Chitinispirillaceae bacterium]|nr:hypothetical protein [Chitinispirillaceae bacterium]
MAKTPFSCRRAGSSAAAALTLSLSLVAAAAAHQDSTASAALRPAVKDTVSATLSTADSFDVNTGLYLGGGVALTIGGAPVFTLWQDGLPASLADLRLSDTSFMLAGGPGDTLKLAFNTQKSPDVYNMMFPLSVSFGRLAGKNRYAAALTFTMLSKNARFTVGTGSAADSLVDVNHSMGLYAVTLDLLYGRSVPDRYFSIDKSDRTDLLAGVSVSPFIGISKTASTDAAPDSSPRLSAVSDGLSQGMTSVSASGISFGWRLGIAKMRRLSKKGGLEGRLCWCGTWSAAFSTPDGKLTEKDISPKSGAPDRKVSYFSNRFEISVALIRKL